MISLIYGDEKKHREQQMPIGKELAHRTESGGQGWEVVMEGILGTLVEGCGHSSTVVDVVLE